MPAFASLQILVPCPPGQPLISFILCACMAHKMGANALPKVLLGIHECVMSRNVEFFHPYGVVDR